MQQAIIKTLLPSRTLVVLITISVLLLAHLQTSQASLNWLSVTRLSKSVNTSSERVCDRLPGWSRAQRSFCRRHVAFVDTIQRAAQLTIDECQYQFRSRRWNCSTAPSGISLFARLPESGMREAAFVSALSSAALTYQVTRACSEGKLTDCTCDESKHGIAADGHRWSGCSDNIAYGMALAETFLDVATPLRNKQHLTLLNVHNYEAGRQVIEKNMVKQCKCHGVSGSCELKTCWRAMPSFNLIGVRIKEKYDAAVQVELRRQKEQQQHERLQRRQQRRVKLVPQSYRRLSSTDLVYTHDSPDFCRPSQRLAARGTKGRVCNRTSRGIDNCDTLCCGRAYRTQRELVKFKCQCTFVWCCSVQCKECESIQEVTKCV